MRQRGVDGDQVLFTVAQAPVVFAPRHFGGLGLEIRAGDMVVGPDLGAAQAGKERLGRIRAGAVVAVRPLVIDALGKESVVQRISMRSFVGVNATGG
jgi:hypothetical protein